LAVAITVAALLVPPTAKQTVALGQSMSVSGVFVPAGADFAVQVEPPFVVAMIVGELPTRPPTAKQVVALAHETPWRAAVTDSDVQACSDWAPFASAHGHAGGLRLSTANPAADEVATRAGYYGRDTARQRSRLHAGGDIEERIETAQLLLGSPDTVVDQVDRLRRELGVGIVELAFIAPGAEEVRRSLELFGTRVLPRMREL
jgi:alkanesulfonate monooxygenase SsuD/methylene tetrahydromethanopterin reductase-like flavin-dependent oxidoreductase (luciferase family)